tara:strand:+ start:51 stop:521 length:471 start_codon:yes stop_codon:yes gene_type:complete
MITKKDLKDYKGDRRSKEFRLMKEEFASQKEIRGLGDVVEAFTKATGIKAVVDKVSDVLGVDCGCDERREKLNNLLPRGRKQVRCMTDEEYTEYGLFMNTRKKGRLEADEVKYLMSLYTNIYNRKWAKVRCTQCALKGRVKEAMADLDRTYNNHNQ